MKLVNNVLSATAMAATSEAMVTGVKAGLDPRLMLDVINAGTGRNTATEDKFTKAILPGTFDLGFAAGLMLKDVKLFLAERERSACRQTSSRPLPGSSRPPATNAEQMPTLAVVQPIEKRAGVKVRAP